MKCDTCKFWEEGREIGSCHRHAPKPVVVGHMEGQRPMDTVWPRTSREEWCGEWTAKVEVEPE
jgi:hypothetical protein